MKRNIDKEKRRKIKMKKLNNYEFLEKCKSIHKDIYDYDNTFYINMRTKVSVICKEHGVFLILPYNHINGQGCVKCVNDKHKLISISDEQIVVFNEIHNNKYNYNNLSVFGGKIIITCTQHGDFEQIIYNHQNGHGCYECSLNNRRVIKYKVCDNCNENKELSYFRKGYRKCNTCLELKIESKVCRVCNTDKPIDLFYIRKYKEIETYKNECKQCLLDKQASVKRIYRQNNKTLLREKRRIYHKKRLEVDELYKLKVSARNLIRKSLKSNGYTKNSRTQKILGCSYEDFKLHLENLFLPGMSWNNRKYWHIDHIIPSDFAINEEELIKLNNFKNLRPLWENMNLEKSNRILEKTELYYQILKNRETITQNNI
jgi:hypothetical protein